jgi:ubiquinone/menaquinone biosynthesis C-methylase UbiE
MRSHIIACMSWARTFATVYEPFCWAGERTGMRALRSEQLEHARGRTVEIGAGTGLNLAHYPDNLTELILTEPDRAMRARLEKKAQRQQRRVKIVDAPAERLPFADSSVDTVVSTFVLCTVDDPSRVLREVARVLRAGGQLLFVEHVRSDSPTLARWQDRLERPWRAFARGCRCNRATEPLIASCGFGFDNVEYTSWRAMPPIIRPLIAGRALIGDTK